MALYRGLPYDLPFGIELYSEQLLEPGPARLAAARPPRRRHRPRAALRGRRRLAGRGPRGGAPQPSTSRPPAGGRRRPVAGPGRPGAQQGATSQGGGGHPASARAAGSGQQAQRTAVDERPQPRAARRWSRSRLLVTAGFTAVFIVRSNQIGDLSLTYGAYFLAICLAAHLLIRLRLPYADPYLFPLVALLAAFGLVILFRIDESLARRAGSLIRRRPRRCSRATIVLLRDYHVLERYRYLIATRRDRAAAAAAPPRDRRAGQRRLPRDRHRAALVPARRVRRRSASSSSSPATCARSARCWSSARGGCRGHAAAAQAPRPAARRLGRGDGDARLHPRPRQLADVLRRLPGADLRRHRRGSRSWSSGWLMFVRRRLVLRQHGPHVEDRVDIWLDPFQGRPEGAASRSPSRCSRRPTAACSGRGSGESLLQLPGAFKRVHPAVPGLRQHHPAPHTDFIYAVIVNELGLFGAAGVVLIYILIAARGFKTAVMAPDGFSKLLAAGLTAVFALQAFVIIGGVVRVIPLTGVTLPFISYGGSSVVANMVLLALLLMISDRARRPAEARRAA